jgi:hypothetical protein
VRLLLGIVVVALAALSAGCPKQAATLPANPGPQPGQPGGPPQQGPKGADALIPGNGPGINGGRGAGERTKLANDLHQIGLFYKQYEAENGQAPANMQAFLDYIRNDSNKIAASIQNGTIIVYWNVRSSALPSGASNTVLGYDAAVPRSGGWVLMADGTEQRITAEDFAKAPKAGN